MGLEKNSCVRVDESGRKMDDCECKIGQKDNKSTVGLAMTVQNIFLKINWTFCLKTSI